MKKLKNRILPFLLAAWCLTWMILPGAASSMEHEGLLVTVQMDKEVYDAGEPITAKITVENTNSHSVTIASLEQLIPEGYQLVEDSQAVTENVDLAPYESLIMEVTFAGGETSAEETGEEGFFDRLIHGQTWGIPNLLLALIVVTAIVVFMLLT